MFNAFMSDKSSFKNIMILLVLFGMVLLCGAFMMLGKYNDIVITNNKAAAEFKSQANWLHRYDADAVAKINKVVLQPCKESEIDRVQKEQLQLLSSKGVVVTSVKKAPLIKSKAKTALKGVKSSLTFRGKWDNIVAALNAFEKQKDLVVITDLVMNAKDDIEGHLDYVIYYK